MDEAEVDALIQEAGPDSDGQLNYTSTLLYLMNTVKPVLSCHPREVQNMAS